MDYRFEPISAIDFSLFSSLNRFRQDSIIKARKCLINDENNRILINIGKMDDIPYNVRHDEKMPAPLDYYLFYVESVIYGIEVKRIDEVIEQSVTIHYRPTIFRIPEQHAAMFDSIVARVCF